MKVIVSGICVWLLAGCSVFLPVEDDPVRHILEAQVTNRKPFRAVPAVAVAKPSLPPYLERVELVTRTADGRVVIHEDDLWSEPLDSAISRVIADNLRRLTGSTNIQAAKNFVARDYNKLVEIRIDRFDPLPDGSMALECTWKAQGIGEGEAAPKSFRTVVPVRDVLVGEGVEGFEMSGRVVAMNEALRRLSVDIRSSL